jgi:hypothetical protein
MQGMSTKRVHGLHAASTFSLRVASTTALPSTHFTLDTHIIFFSKPHNAFIITLRWNTELIMILQSPSKSAGWSAAYKSGLWPFHR